MPICSVIIPCFNAARYLPRALESLDAQSFRDFEVIVIDDGSTEHADIAYLDKLPPHIRLLRQKNRGLSGARNTGFRHAEGELVLPLDCDDALAPDFLQRTVAALQRDPEAGFAFTHIDLVGERSGILVKHYNAFEQLFLNQLPYCVLQRRAMWEALGGYDESMRDGYEDWEYNIRALRAGYRAVEVPEPLFIYTVSSSGMLLARSRRLHGQLWSYIQNRNPELFRFGRLVELYRRWRSRPSTRTLAIYWPMLVAFKVLPVAWFNALFSRFGFLSSSARLPLR